MAVERVEYGQPLGFARQADGAVVAVAGATIVPLQPGSHTWEGLPAEGSPTWLGRVRQAVAGVADGLAVPAFLLVLAGGSAAYALAASGKSR